MTNRLICFLLSISSLMGCGYAFQGGGSVLPRNVKKIYIPLVTNLSTNPTIANLLTESLKGRFERFGVVEIVEDDINADAALNVVIKQLDSSTQTSTASGDVAQQLSINALVSADLVQSTGVTLWQNPNIRLRQVFGNTSNAVVTSSSSFAESGLASADVGSLNQRELSRSQEQVAIENMVDQIATLVYDQAVSPEF